MSNRLGTYFSNTKEHMLALLSRNKFEASPNGQCCISISPQEFTFVYVRKEQEKINIELCESYPTANNSLPATLTSIVKNKQLKNVACSWVLQPEDYQLLITDALPVVATEFQAAIRWKIKDALRFPLNDVVIDSCPMPMTKASSQNKIMVIAAQASKLKIVSDQIRESGLDLRIIDIPELCLRNITALYEQVEQSTALIYIQEKSIQLLIICKKQLYIARNLMFSLQDTGALPQVLERLAAEIQRSFDYYQSQWRQAIPTRIIFASTKLITPESVNILSEKLKTPINMLNIMETLGNPQKINFDQQAKYLPIIGGVIRETEPKLGMLQEINLATLPEKAKFKLNQATVLYSYAGLLLFLLLYYFAGLWQKHHLTAQHDIIMNEVLVQQQKLAAINQQYPYSDPTALSKATSLLQQQYDTKVKAIDLLSPNANFSNYLLGFANAATTGSWLNQIMFNRGENKIFLKGHALQSAVLEVFFNQLTKQAAFSQMNFELVEIKDVMLPGSFYITAKQVNKL